MLGPHGAKNKKDKVVVEGGNASQSALNGGGAQTESSYAGSTAQGTDPPSSPTAVTEGSRLSGEGWNLKRYQREDEALWGIDFHAPGQKIKDAITKAGNSASRFVEARLSRSGDATIEEREEPKSYFAPRIPPVNELHPPIVSTPSSRDESRWMMQPPPSAKIMEGKERVVRSRADSNGSSRSRRVAEEPLSRQVTGKLVESRLQSGQPFPDRPLPPLRTNTNTSTRSRARRIERRRSPSPNSSDSSTEMRARTRRKPPTPIMVSKTSAGDSDDSLDSPYQLSTVQRPRAISRRTSVKSKASASLTKLDTHVPRSRSSTLNGQSALTPGNQSKLNLEIGATPATIPEASPPLKAS